MDNEEKQTSKRLPGFYIALCCCVIAVGIAGYFTERAGSGGNSGESAPVQSPVSEIADASLPDGSDTLPANAAADESGNTVKNDSVSVYVAPPEDTDNTDEAREASAPQVIYEDMTEDNSAEDEPREEEAAEAAAILTSPSFSLPAPGDVIGEFTDTLSYNSALGDWRAHNGADIAVAAGGSVCAAADGTVSRISSDAMGEYVVIDHDGGFSSKYRSLSSVEDIKEGSAVKAGDVIGTVSECRVENVKEPHLHFELYKDGKAVNPLDYVG